MSEPSDTPTKLHIKVTDRRLFDSEGNLRADVDPDAESPSPPTEPPTEPPAEAPAVAPASDSVAGTETPVSDSVAEPAASKSRWFRKTATPEPPPEPATPPAPGTAPATRDLPRDLSGLVESQYFEALLYMGAVPHPATGKVMEDLDMAQYKIDLLGMLEAKTEGNRTPEESKALEDVLYQLRMLYLQKSKVTKL